MDQIQRAVLHDLSIDSRFDPFPFEPPEHVLVREQRSNWGKIVESFGSRELAARSAWVLEQSCGEVVADHVAEDVVFGVVDGDVFRVFGCDDRELALGDI